MMNKRKIKILLKILSDKSYKKNFATNKPKKRANKKRKERENFCSLRFVVVVGLYCFEIFKKSE
jgi:hypothetical protein